MLLVTRHAPGAVVGAIASGAIALAMLGNSAAPAFADPSNCTSADLAGVASGVAAATSAYLFTHPDVNAFFTSMAGRPRSEIGPDVQSYLDANPQVQAELQGIRQPMLDLRDRCGWTGQPGQDELANSDGVANP